MTPATPTVPKRRSAADTGETDGDGRAFAGGAADRNGPTVFFDYFFDAGETQPDAGLFGRKKGLKHFVDDFSGNRNPVVLDENLHVESSSGTRCATP